MRAQVQNLPTTIKTRINEICSLNQEPVPENKKSETCTINAF